MSSLAAAIEARSSPKAEDVPRPPPLLGRTSSLGTSGAGLNVAPRLHLRSKSGADLVVYSLVLRWVLNQAILELGQHYHNC